MLDFNGFALGFDDGLLLAFAFPRVCFLADGASSGAGGGCLGSGLAEKQPKAYSTTAKIMTFHCVGEFSQREYSSALRYLAASTYSSGTVLVPGRIMRRLMVSFLMCVGRYGKLI
jgi:hypothetical protein